MNVCKKLSQSQNCFSYKIGNLDIESVNKFKDLAFFYNDYIGFNITEHKVASSSSKDVDHYSHHQHNHPSDSNDGRSRRPSYNPSSSSSLLMPHIHDANDVPLKNSISLLKTRLANSPYLPNDCK
ncbi:hypothetical protein HELRODRAFT_162804 [Helobdella robusta]|uniref:Uncharacterized protein n=1 Tax=Helobdella robusta TaxID=6412 RepID=T1ET67_HELRO|nr:hypothetical protein HELRODRAFT_162804 [Helobdella robusta]ESN99285.1 hypothetical protein HELRODRAFT_162804 [Helobdella robusta]